MEEVELNRLIFDYMNHDQDLQQIFQGDESCVEMSAFQNAFPMSPSASCPATPTEAANLKNFEEMFKTSTPELEHYLKQTNPLQEVRPKRKSSLSLDKTEKVKKKHLKTGKNKRSEVDIKQRTEIVNTSHKETLKWGNYESEDWWKLYDSSLTETEPPSLLVTCDKGFSFSTSENVYICQKKNHFQITLTLGVPNSQSFIKVKDVYQNVTSYQVHLYAVKTESTQKKIKVEKSLTDRTRRPYHPIKFPENDSSTKTLTIGRLHFTETTLNNMRKKGKLNPDQRYFTLVVDIHAYTKQGDYSVCRKNSENLIVRASNPGQFENCVTLWSNDKYGDSVYKMGNVGINNDKPEESLSVNGNLWLTGQILQPSDRRIQKVLQKTDTQQHLENVCSMQLYKYRHSNDYAEYAGLADQEEDKLGVLAQELRTLIPEAVKEESEITLPSGTVIKDLLLVNQNRLLMESVGALQELFKITKNLSTRLVELEGRNETIQEVFQNALSEATDTEGLIYIN